MTLGDNKQGIRSGPETLWFRGRFRFALPRALSAKRYGLAGAGAGAGDGLD